MAAGPNRNDTMKNVMAMDTHNSNPSSSSPSDAMDIEGFLLSDCWYDFVNGPGNNIAGNPQSDTLVGINGETTSNQIGPNLIQNQSLNHPNIPLTTQNLAVEEPLPFSFATPDQSDHSLHFLQNSYPSFSTLYNNNESNLGYSQSQPGPSNVINGVGNYNIPLATNLGNQIVQDQKIPTVDNQFLSSAPNPSPILEFSQQTMQAVDPSFQNPFNSGGMFYDSNVVNSQPGPSSSSSFHWEIGKQYTEPNFGPQSLYNTNSGHLSAFPSAPIPSDSSDSKIVKQITHHKAGLVRVLKLYGDTKLGLFYYATDAVHVKAAQYATTFSEKLEFNSNEEAAMFLSKYFKLREQEGYEYRGDQDPPPLFYKILSMRPGDCSSTSTTLSADPGGPSVAAATANYEANLSDQAASPNSNYDDEGELDMAATNSSQAANRKYKRRKDQSREFDLAEQRKLIKTMPLEQLKEWYHLRRDEAAVKLGICETAVTKIYNKYYPNRRWPYRKVNSLIKEMRKLRKLKTNPGERSVDEILREMDKTKQTLDEIYETDSLEFLPFLLII